jgi:glycosyl transferase family 25
MGSRRMTSSGQIPIFAISLDDATERRAALSDAMAELGLAFEFIDAIDGRAGLPQGFESQVNRAGASQALGRAMTDAEFACALSHIRAYEKVVTGEATHALILEDDAIPLPGLRDFVHQGGALAAPLVLLHHLNARVLKGTGRDIGGRLVAHDLAVPCFRAAAYSVSKDAARHLKGLNTPVSAPADWPGDITRIKAAVVLPEIVSHPPENPGQSTLTPSGRTRSRPRLSRFLDPNYVRRILRKMKSEKVS